MTLNNFKKQIKSNSGMTLVEMIVSFALLAIFLAATTAILATISNMYFHIKGESASKQISNIILSKISSEIEGSTEFEIIDDETVVLNNRSNTKIQIFSSSNKFKIRYFSVVNDDVKKEETIWELDDKVYNGFKVDSLKFIKANTLTSYSDSSLKEYGLYDFKDKEYNDNVVIILLKITSPRYGT
jgi:prepilin-type N-terminal cleavage/methylation domain-containing protein